MRKLVHGVLILLAAVIFGTSAALAQSRFEGIVSQYSAAVSISTATTTRLVVGTTTQTIYVTSFNVIAAGTGNIQFVYGTGGTCGTGQTALTGNYNLVAQAGIAAGAGVGPLLLVPPGNDLCAVTSAAVGMAGSYSFAQF